MDENIAALKEGLAEWADDVSSRANEILRTHEPGSLQVMHARHALEMVEGARAAIEELTAEVEA